MHKAWKSPFSIGLIKSDRYFSMYTTVIDTEFECRDTETHGDGSRQIVRLGGRRGEVTTPANLRTTPTMEVAPLIACWLSAQSIERDSLPTISKSFFEMFVSVVDDRTWTWRDLKKKDWTAFRRDLDHSLGPVTTIRCSSEITAL